MKLRFPATCIIGLLAVVCEPPRALWAVAGRTESPTLLPASAYERGLALLAAGKQVDAEALMERTIRNEAGVDRTGIVSPENIFFAAVCVRSRFEIEGADRLFNYVLIGPGKNNRHRRAAGLILNLDAHKPGTRTEEDFVALDQLALTHPDDPLLMWMVAVECRSLGKPQIGVERYKLLCAMWKPGPVLVHQTYANLLDDLRRYDESLEHRKLAIQLEPAAWSFDGLGNTLNSLHRWNEADEAYTQSTNLAPDSPHYWKNWAISKRDRGDAVSATKLNQRAAEAEKAAGKQ